MRDGCVRRKKSIAFMGLPTVVLCPKPNGVCHNTGAGFGDEEDYAIAVGVVR